jgi:hypothetical protein
MMAQRNGHVPRGQWGPWTDVRGIFSGPMVGAQSRQYEVADLKLTIYRLRGGAFSPVVMLGGLGRSTKRTFESFGDAFQCALSLGQQALRETGRALDGLQPPGDETAALTPAEGEDTHGT